ncbi:heme-binding protein [Streptomyces virginiae]|uniref:heme-binding protein n=1 Tax=Streptomyces virginiae TaxID=1961 RepID=UPI003639A58D
MTTEDAELLVAAATSAAEAAGATVGVTVLDAGGHLLAYRRDDRAVLISGWTVPCMFLAGGLPVHRDGRIIGARGVGGGSPEQDHAFAAAALDALV